MNVYLSIRPSIVCTCFGPIPGLFNAGAHPSGQWTKGRVQHVQEANPSETNNPELFHPVPGSSPESPIMRACFWTVGGSLEYPEKTHTRMGRTYTLHKKEPGHHLNCDLWAVRPQSCRPQAEVSQQTCSSGHVFKFSYPVIQISWCWRCWICLTSQVKGLKGQSQWKKTKYEQYIFANAIIMR